MDGWESSPTRGGICLSALQGEALVLIAVLHGKNVARENRARSLLQVSESNRALCPSWTRASAQPLGLQAWWCGGKGEGRRVAKRANGDTWSGSEDTSQ